MLSTVITCPHRKFPGSSKKREVRVILEHEVVCLFQSAAVGVPLSIRFLRECGVGYSAHLQGNKGSCPSCCVLTGTFVCEQGHQPLSCTSGVKKRFAIEFRMQRASFPFKHPIEQREHKPLHPCRWIELGGEKLSSFKIKGSTFILQAGAVYTFAQSLHW